MESCRWTGQGNDPVYVHSRSTLFRGCRRYHDGGMEDAMTTLLRRLLPDPRDVRAASTPVEPVPVPCAARPGTPFRHVDGPCQCFFGGPAPEFPPSAGAPA